jgi:hypothetical protein
MKQMQSVNQMYKNFRCINGHEIKVDFLNDLHSKGPFKVPCPSCGTDYIVRVDETYEILKKRPFKFPSLHY